ncbi:MAG: hypothetical protein QXM68_02525 [Candidatus Aenigmatarchaeota archaeon]|nr:hypothetical protein [Candidatus Aenigmarchaeota archaeon]
MDIMSLLGFNKPKPIEVKEKKGGFKISVSSGLYRIARSDELQTLVKKVGYALTRGTSAIEIASDIPNEINYTEGREIRYIAEHQGIEMTLHGDLEIPFEMPDRTEWINAQDKFEKSIKSAVFGGCTYVNFHSCLREWLELFTYAGQRLEITMCDHLGRMFSELFKEDKEKGSGKLAKWLVSTSSVEDTPENRYKKKYDFVSKYIYNILGREEIEKLNSLVSKTSAQQIIGTALDRLEKSNLPDDVKENVSLILQNRIIDFQQKLDTIFQYNLLTSAEMSNIQRNVYRNIFMQEVEDRLSQRWYDENMRGGSLDDIYVIIAHYLYFNQDPLWKDMEKAYSDVFNQFKIEKDDDWLLKMLDRANTTSDVWSLRFKEFYYGVVAAKYLQGHVIRAIKWMKTELKKSISEEIKSIEKDSKKAKEEEEKIFKNIDNLKICFETPDARNPELGGRYMLWKTKQIYLAVKHARLALKNDETTRSHSDKIFMIIDWEHVATQGVDPFYEADDFVKTIEFLGEQNAGDLILGVHSNYPSPLQPHKPIEIADRPVIYRLLYKLRKIGFGKNQMAYLLFERGGGDNPFKGSIIALRAIANELEKDTDPDNLPLDFFALPEGTRDYARQYVIIKEHAFDPLKGLIKVPEEDYTFIGTAAIKSGKQPDQWKKEELR